MARTARKGKRVKSAAESVPTQAIAKPIEGSEKDSIFGSIAQHLTRVPTFVLLLPGIILCALVVWFPLGRTILLSFQRFNLINSAEFVGLSNYTHLKDDSLMWTAIRNTGIMIIARVVVVGAVWLLLGFLWRAHKVVSAHQVLVAVAPLPFFTPVIAAYLWAALGHPDMGPLSGYMSWMDESTAFRSVLVVDTLHILAITIAVGLFAYALAQPKDNARYGSLAALNAVGTLLLIFVIAGGLQAFSWSFVITRGGPDNSTLTLPLLIYQYMFSFFRFGFGSTYATLLIVISVVLALVLWNTLRTTSLRIVGRPLANEQFRDQARANPELWVMAAVPGIVILLPYLWLLVFADFSSVPPSADGALPTMWGQWIRNSILTPGLIIWLIQIPAALLAAYALVIKPVGRPALNQTLLFFFVLSALVGTIIVGAPLFILARSLGWINTAMGGAFPLVSGGVAIVVFILLFRGIAGRPGRLNSNAALPVIGLVGILLTYWASQRLYWPLIIMTDIQGFTTSLAALQIVSQSLGNLRSVIVSGLLPLAVPFSILLVWMAYLTLQRTSLYAKRSAPENPTQQGYQ